MFGDHKDFCILTYYLCTGFLLRFRYHVLVTHYSFNNLKYWKRAFWSSNYDFQEWVIHIIKALLVYTESDHFLTPPLLLPWYELPLFLIGFTVDSFSIGLIMFAPSPLHTSLFSSPSPDQFLAVAPHTSKSQSLYNGIWSPTLFTLTPYLPLWPLPLFSLKKIN